VECTKNTDTEYSQERSANLEKNTEKD